jgi:hypothetical protein
MIGRWKARLKKMADANEKARQTETRRMTPARAKKVLESLLSDPPAPPVPKEDHPMSSGHRTRRKHV